MQIKDISKEIHTLKFYEKSPQSIQKQQQPPFHINNLTEEQTYTPQLHTHTYSHTRTHTHTHTHILTQWDVSSNLRTLFIGRALSLFSN